MAPIAFTAATQRKPAAAVVVEMEVVELTVVVEVVMMERVVDTIEPSLQAQL